MVCMHIARYPIIDANMKELLLTGFMSNRGRQVGHNNGHRDHNTAQENRAYCTTNGTLHNT